MYGLRKLSVVACLAVVAASLQAYDWNQPVTISSKGQTLKQFFADLKASHGVPIDVSPICADEIISLRVKDRPMSEVIAKIADATGLGFLGSGDGYLVVRSEGNTPALTERHKSVIGGKIKTTLDADSYVKNAGEKIDSVAVLQTFLADPRARQSSATFADQALPILLRDEDPATWASVPLNERWVYSLSPNSRQKFMSNAMKRVANQLVSDYRRTLFELQKIPANSRPGQFRAFRNDAVLTAAINAGNPEILVTVVRDIDSVRIDMYLLGANMQTMSSASRTLQLGGTGSSNHAFNQPFFKFDEYGTAAKQVAAAFVQGRFAGQRNTWGKDTADKARTNDPAMLPFVGGIDPGARSILLGQTKLDPVATLVDYAFVDQMTTDNYVIAFPDHMASELAWDASRDNLNSTAKTWDEVTFKKEGDWSVMGLADPISAWSTRVPRGTLYALEQKVSRQYGLVSLSDKASYARAAGRGIGTDNWDTGAMSWLFGTSAGQEIRDVHGNDYFPLMIYGALSADQRKQAATSSGLPWNQISGIYQLLTDWYYNGRRDPSYVVQAASPGGTTSLNNITLVDRGFIEVQGLQQAGSRVPVINGAQITIAGNMERTELLPTGLSSATSLRFSMSSRDGFVALNSQNGESQIFDARSYARNKANAAYNPRGAGVNDPSFFKQFLNTSNISISATLLPYDQVRLSEGADGVEAQGGFGSYDALKGSTRAQIDRYYADYENAYLRNSGREQTIRRGGRGGGTPPPAQ